MRMKATDLPTLLSIVCERVITFHKPTMNPKCLVVILFLQILVVIADDTFQNDCKEDADCRNNDKCIQGKCLPVRDYGEECLHDDQCALENTLCQGGRCLCRSDLVFARGKCRTSNPLGYPCTQESDCTTPRSTCGREGKCQCRFIADKFGNCLGGYRHECQDDSECATEVGLACIKLSSGMSGCLCRESNQRFDDDKCQNITDPQSCKTFLTCPENFMCDRTLRQCVPLTYRDQPWFVKCRKDDAYCPPGHYCEMSAGVCLAIKSQDEPEERHLKVSIVRNPYFWMKVTFIGIASVMAIALLIKMFGPRRRRSPPAPNAPPSAPSVSSATTHPYYPSTISPNPKVQSAYPSLHAV